MDTSFYYKYSDYLKNKYGEKVYKLPISLRLHAPTGKTAKAAVLFVPKQAPALNLSPKKCR